MKNDILQPILVFLILIIGGTLNSALAHTLTLDDFSNYQYVIDKGGNGEETTDSINLIGGTILTNASRTFIGLANENTRRATIEIATNSDKQLVQIANGPASEGEAAIVWHFDPVDLTLVGTGFLLEVFDIDLSVNAEIIVNDVASSGMQTFSEAGNFLLKFSDFSNNAVFSSVSSLSLNLTGPRGWDGSFRLSMDAIPVTTLPNLASVPVPSAYFLMGSVLLGFIGITRKKIV